MITIANREVAYIALFNLLQNISIFKTCTRRLKHWQDTSSEEQPALYMEHTGESTAPVRGLPNRIILEVNLWVYVKSEGAEVGPIMNPILDQIEKSLQPINDGDHTMTLGGLVHHCWIEGQTQIFEGDLGDEAVVIIPVKILVT